MQIFQEVNVEFFQILKFYAFFILSAHIEISQLICKMNQMAHFNHGLEKCMSGSAHYKKSI